MAQLFRENLIAAACVALHELVLLVAPVILLWEFRSEEWLLGRTAGVEFAMATFDQGFTARLNWATLIRFEVPMLVG